MRFLRILRLVLIVAWALRYIFRAKTILHRVPCGGDRFGGHIDPVGPHIGNVPGLVEALCRAHRLACAHAELSAGLLLQGGRHERRAGVAAGRFGFNRFDGQIAAGDRLNGQFGLGFVLNIEAVELFPRQHGKPRLIFLPARRSEDRFDAPVFLRIERLDLHLALNDQAQADGLHASRTFRAGQFAPQNGREVETHQIIQRAPRQIGFDQRHIHVARITHRLGNGFLGDRVKGDSRDFRIFLDRAAFGQGFLQMPTDRFTFPVGVGREDQFVVIGQRIGDGFDMFLAVAGDFPLHVEFMVGINRAILWR